MDGSNFRKVLHVFWGFTVVEIAYIIYGLVKLKLYPPLITAVPHYNSVFLWRFVQFWQDPDRLYLTIIALLGWVILPTIITVLHDEKTINNPNPLTDAVGIFVLFTTITQMLLVIIRNRQDLQNINIQSLQEEIEKYIQNVHSNITNISIFSVLFILTIVIPVIIYLLSKSVIAGVISFIILFTIFLIIGFVWALWVSMNWVEWAITVAVIIIIATPPTAVVVFIFSR